MTFGLARKHRGLLFPLAVLVVFAASACLNRSEGPNSDETRRASPKAVPSDFYSSAEAVCSLLTQRDLRIALGRNYAAGVELDQVAKLSVFDVAGITGCTYGSAGGDPRRVVTGVAHAFAEESFSDVWRRRSELFSKGATRKAEGGIALSPQELTNIGEKAFWDPGLEDLFVLSKGKLIAVMPPIQVHEPNAYKLEISRRLAEKMLTRLN